MNKVYILRGEIAYEPDFATVVFAGREKADQARYWLIRFHGRQSLIKWVVEEHQVLY